MRRHRFARRLLAGAISTIAIAGATGVANADPDPSPAPGPARINNLLPPQNPILFPNPDVEGGQGPNWSGTGMYCQNLGVRCQ
jgi:hypothetical protein